jgi:peptide/nickel transport system ATP-binding protein
LSDKLKIKLAIMVNVDIKSIKVKDNSSEKLLLSDINFQLDNNKINVILGKNGTGKSTLIKGLTRLLDERFYTVTGSVLFGKKDLLLLAGEELLNIRRTKICYVFQDAINSFDALKKMGFYFRDYEEDEKLVLFLNDFLLPEKGELFSLYPYEVSGGMAQRLLLTIALLKNPEILILDEPTSGIDSPISNLILLRLREFVKTENKSVLLVTQDLQFAKSAGDRISYLSDGTISPFYETNEFFEKQKISASENFISAYNQLL